MIQEQLIKGNYYYTKYMGGWYVMKYSGNDWVCDYHIWFSDMKKSIPSYYTTGGFSSIDLEREASEEEIMWLEECHRQGIGVEKPKAILLYSIY